MTCQPTSEPSDSCCHGCDWRAPRLSLSSGSGHRGGQIPDPNCQRCTSGDLSASPSLSLLWVPLPVRACPRRGTRQPDHRHAGHARWLALAVSGDSGTKPRRCFPPPLVGAGEGPGQRCRASGGSLEGGPRPRRGRGRRAAVCHLDGGLGQMPCDKILQTGWLQQGEFIPRSSGSCAV